LPDPVLAAAQPARPPRAAGVARAVEQAPGRAGGTYGGSVVDVGTGKVLYAQGDTRALTPASTMKLLSSAAALSALGPQHRFTTRVVRARSSQIVLVGGGDPYLETGRRGGRASMADLATATARALSKAKQRRVALRYDASRFSGPAFSPTWPAGYRGLVAPMSALWVNQARSGSGRAADPAGSAARAFATALERRGIDVTTVKAGRAARNADVVAAVRSLPLEQIVEAVLTHSDNDAAEVVFRQAAVASGEPGSYAGGQRAVERRLRTLDVWRPGTRVYDGSGLSRDNAVPPATLTALLRLAADPRHPELRALLTGLPVAGVAGSLSDRFRDARSRDGRGLVRAKTGTLTGVYALAGYVRSRDGQLLVYAFLVNRAGSQLAAETWLDRVTARLSQCGCR